MWLPLPQPISRYRQPSTGAGFTPKSRATAAIRSGCMANRATVVTKDANADLPKIEGRTSTQ